MYVQGLHSQFHVGGDDTCNIEHRSFTGLERPSYLFSPFLRFFSNDRVQAKVEGLGVECGGCTRRFLRGAFLASEKGHGGQSRELIGRLILRRNLSFAFLSNIVIVSSIRISFSFLTIQKPKAPGYTYTYISRGHLID